MSFFIPNGPKIPPNGNFSSANINEISTSGVKNTDDVKITSTEGTVCLVVGDTVYKWPTSAPPSINFVLGIDSSDTVDGITTYNLAWVEGFICFHSSSKALLRSGEFVTMDKLRYGDDVLCVDNNMNLIYSPVVDFTGVFPDRSGICVYLNNDLTKETLIVSGIHLLRGEHKFMPAKDFEVGMRIHTRKGLATVTKMETGTEKGWYTPLTSVGTIVVDDIVASCHTSNSHDLIRAFYKPLHLYLYFFPKKTGELPVERYHWYSQGFRRGPVGQFLIKVLSLLM